MVINFLSYFVSIPVCSVYSYICALLKYSKFRIKKSLQFAYWCCCFTRFVGKLLKLIWSDK